MPEFILSPVGAFTVAWTTGDSARSARFERGRLLLRHAVAAGWPTDAAARTGAVDIARRCAVCGGGDHGAPLIVDRPLVASLSHAGRVSVAVVAATGDAAAIGIDVETTHQSQERRAAIIALTGAGHDDPVRHWTRVEAVLKADGRGLRVDPSRVRIDEGGGAPGGVLARIADEHREYQVHDVDGPAGFTTSIASRLP